MMQLLKTNLEEVLLDGQLSLQLSEVGMRESILLKTNLEEVLLDGQLSLQLSEVAVHEGSVFGAQLRIVRVLLVDVSNSLTKNMAIKKNRLHAFKFLGGILICNN
jgi:hypothetical protein